MSYLKYAFPTAALLLSSQVFANTEEAIGYVKTTQGNATVITKDQQSKAQPGTPLYLGSILKTGDDGSMGVTLKDNTVLSIGPDSELTTDEYLYKPSENQLKLAARLAKGTLHYISGVIAKLKPEAVSVNTPTGIIGVRGTRFVVKTED